MLNTATVLRKQRGMEIAATTPITPRGEGVWLVPAASRDGKYRVEKGLHGFHCTCPDYELRGETCKHGYAVEFVLRRETKPDGTVIETRAARVTYAQDWPAYNKAQTGEKRQFCSLLRDLVADVPSPEQQRGRPSLPLNDMIFAAAYKVYSTVSARRFMCDLNDAAREGFISKTPHYNSIFNVLDRESLTPILKELIARSSLPLQAVETAFAIDSTGIGTQSFYRHFSAKYGQDKERREYLKVHAMIGVKTNIVTAVEVTDSRTSDPLVLPDLLGATSKRFEVKEVCADKAYSTRMNLRAIESNGAVAYVPFKKNAVGTTESKIWNRLFHFFNMNREEFLPKYHQRSNVESTFSALKRKFGDTIRSKTPVAQRNEALLKVLCYNIVCVIHEIHETGVVGQFPMLNACPRKDPIAQEFELS